MTSILKPNPQCLWLAMALITLAGCGGAYDSTVAGIVTLDGDAVPKGAVLFAPQSAGSSAYGMIQDDGSYALYTGREEGLPPGKYVVTVSANESAGTASKDGGPPPMGKALTPEWYRDPATSGLTFDVTPGDNEIDLELKSTPPPGWKPKPTRGRR
jgi:hypothetical protein